MKITDSLFSLYNSNLYTNKKAATASQNQFTQTVNSSLSGSNASGTAANVTLYKDAVLSTHNASGASAHVYYDEASGMYKVKGNDADGTEYETLVDVTKIDPNNASRIDMIAIAAFMGKNGDKFAESFLLSNRREMDNYFTLPKNEQKNFIWKSMFAKENQYDDLNYIAQGFYKAGAVDGYARVTQLIQNIKSYVSNS